MAEIDDDLDRVEARMRPGRLSRSGFLGPKESLRDVMAADAKAMQRIGVSFEALGQRLALLLDAALESPDRRASFATMSQAGHDGAQVPDCLSSGRFHAVRGFAWSKRRYCPSFRWHAGPLRHQPSLLAYTVGG
jgi:hypothetical protein